MLNFEQPEAPAEPEPPMEEAVEPEPPPPPQPVRARKSLPWRPEFRADLGFAAHHARRSRSRAGSVAASAPHPNAAMEPEPVITETMAEVYVKQGLYAEAKDVYRKLVQRRPETAR